MNISKKVFLITMFALSFFVRGQANAIYFDEENWEYYFKNQHTNEIKQLTLTWLEWNGIFKELQYADITMKDIPKKDYFENWDLIGYSHYFSWKNFTNIQCRWVDGWLYIDNMKDAKNIENEKWNKCNEIRKNYWDFGKQELTEKDIFKYKIYTSLFIIASIIYWVIFNFFAFLGIIYPVRLILRNMKARTVIYIVLLVSLLCELGTTYLWVQLGWIDWWETIASELGLFIFLIKLPFYIIWFIVFFRKFVKISLIFTNFLRIAFLNELFKILFLLMLFSIIMWWHWLWAISPTSLNVVSILLFIIWISFFIRNKEVIGAYLEKNLNPPPLPPKE